MADRYKQGGVEKNAILIDRLLKSEVRDGAGFGLQVARNTRMGRAHPDSQ